MANGKRIKLSNERRLICDIIEIAKKMPMAPISRTFRIPELCAIRKRTRPRISWPVVMMRAYGLVSQRFPVLRQIYVPYPVPHIYEHHQSVCGLTIHREVDGVNRLFCARISQPENHSLIQLQQIFNDFRRKPIDEIKQLTHQMRFAASPWLVRQLGWKLMTGWMPRGRAKMMGTFGMSLSGFKYAEGTFHLGPCTTILGYDQFCRGGNARVTLTFDHRIIDGVPATEIMEALRETLSNEILWELKQMYDTARGAAVDNEPEIPLRVRYFDLKSEVPARRAA